MVLFPPFLYPNVSRVILWEFPDLYLVWSIGTILPPSFLSTISFSFFSPFIILIEVLDPYFLVSFNYLILVILMEISISSLVRWFYFIFSFHNFILYFLSSRCQYRVWSVGSISSFLFTILVLLMEISVSVSLLDLFVLSLHHFLP